MEEFWVTDEYKRQKGNIKNKRGIISSEMVNKALAIAFEELKGCTDATGRPSIMRALYVAEQMQGEFPVCAALLADGFRLCDEPKPVSSFDELSAAGFSDKIIDTVKILIPDPALTFVEHIRSVKDSGNAVAENIALIGLIYDCDLSKYKNVDERVIEWYHQCMKAMAILEEDVHNNKWHDSDMQYIYTAVSTRTIDIRSDAPSLGGKLSNLRSRPFEFCAIQCGSIEGVLQSFKFADPLEQPAVCRLHGFNARKTGMGRDWRSAQTLYWMGEAYARESAEYQQLLDALYQAAFDQNEEFREELALSKGYTLQHSMGKEDPKQTILTRDEFISRLERLRDAES